MRLASFVPLSLVALLAGTAACHSAGTSPPKMSASKGPSPRTAHHVGGAVAADHVLASKAGTAVLEAGGNAVDAAIAAALSSGVVQPSGSGLGGGGFALVVTPTGEAHFVDFREVAPGAATREMYVGKAKDASTRGGLAVAVPAEGIGLAELHRRYGRAALTTIAGPAIAQATDGFVTGEHLRTSLVSMPAMATLFGDGNRRPLLAKALTDWAASDGEAFRTGWVAQDFVDSASAAGGILTMADLAAYRVEERTPLRRAWEGRTVITAPPPSSGGVVLLEMLGATGAGTSLHCEVEAATHAMAERAVYGGDPAFTPWNVDAQLTDAHLAAIRQDCGPAAFPPEHYAPVAPPPDDHGTLHISVIDGDGMAVALTTTVNTAFGSTVVGRQSGIVLNDEMDDFLTRPGEPNAFGLTQGEANAIAPGKRPLSSMTPTVVLDAFGRPELAVGASGGPFIITGTYQVLTNVLLRGMDAASAVAAPRWHQQWMPPVVTMEAGDPRRAELEAAGHTIRIIDSPFCSVQVVRAAWSREGEGTFDAAADPRKHGEAAVVGR